MSSASRQPRRDAAVNRAQAIAVGPLDGGADPTLLWSVLSRAPGMLWMVDVALRCRFASTAAGQRLGIAPGLQLAAAATADGSEGTAPALVDAHRRALAGDTVHCELRREGATFSCRVEPLRDSSGRIAGAVGTAEDVTVPELLRERQQMLEITLLQSTDGIAIADADGRLLFFNPAAAQIATTNPTGTTLADGPLIWGDCFDPDGTPVPVHDWPIARALRGETTTGRELYTQKPDGVRTYIQIAATPVRDTNGTIVGAVTTFTDITNRKRVESEIRALNDELEERVRSRTAALEAAQRELQREVVERQEIAEALRQHQAELAHALRLHTIGEMAASLAHEINQPLGAIANYAQGCLRRLRAGAVEQQDLLQTTEEIAREALRAGAITRRVRELLRKGDAHRERMDLNRVIAAALDIVAPSARQRNATVAFHGMPHLPPVDVDGIQIEQVVINLVLNALEAIDGQERPGAVEVRTSAAADGRIEVAVCDNGGGLQPSALEQIFEPFFTTKGDGLGMGLAISRSIVEAHGGRLWATPNRPAGATFWFVLPAAPTA